jgi:hypothetical protein
LTWKIERAESDGRQVIRATRSHWTFEVPLQWPMAIRRLVAKAEAFDLRDPLSASHTATAGGMFMPKIRSRGPTWVKP